jgi:excinuclease UvrABC helicase subunit UvrB
MTYEEKIKIANKNAHITTEVIKQDIADTQYEIERMETEIKAYRMLGDKMSMFRADARENGIKERQDFIEKLQAILEVRESGNKSEG